MALSEHEQRLLEQLEQQLNAEDPRFAHSMSSSGRSFSTRRIVLSALVGVAGILVLLVGVSFQNIFIGVGGFLIMGASVYFGTVRPIGGSESHGKGQSIPKSASAPRGGFMGGLEEKWDQRRQGEP